MTHIMERVGIRELRQNLSRYVKRLRSGESFIVTDRGQEVGVLSPPLQQMNPLDRLEAEGRLMQRGQGDLIETIERLGPIRTPPGEPTLSEILEEQRRQQRY